MRGYHCNYHYTLVVVFFANFGLKFYILNYFWEDHLCFIFIALLDIRLQSVISVWDFYAVHLFHFIEHLVQLSALTNVLAHL